MKASRTIEMIAAVLMCIMMILLFSACSDSSSYSSSSSSTGSSNSARDSYDAKYGKGSYDSDMEFYNYMKQRYNNMTGQ